MFRRLTVGACLILVVGCAEPYPESAGGTESQPTTTPTTIETSTSTTTLEPTTSTTSEAPTTTTSTTADPVEESPWIGVEVSVETDHPRAKGIEILANVEHFPVDFLIDGQPAGVFGWYVGGVWNAFDGPSFSVLAVADEPNPYAPTEYEQYEEGVEPVIPDPSTTHILTLWAIDTIAPTRIVITDAMDIELPAPLLQYGSLMSVSQEPWICEVDATLQSYLDPDPAGIHREGNLFAFFDNTGFDELEIDEHYPAVLAFTTTNGHLDIVPPEAVRCILRFDPDNY